MNKNSRQTDPTNDQKLSLLNMERLLRLVTLTGPLWYFGVVAYITLSRFTYRFELEWMEGGSLLELLQLLDGKPLYTPPSLAYTPYIYPPFYYYLAALLAKITGLTWFTPLRLTSLLASLGCIISIFFIVRHATRSAYWGLLAAGMFTATFRVGGAWFDIARVDMLFLFWLLAGLYVLLRTDWRFSELVAGVVFALAFYTKQTAIPVIGILALYLFFFRSKLTAIKFGFVFTSLSLAIALIENSRTQGWYWYYIFDLPRSHTLLEPFLGQLLVQVTNLVRALPIALAIGLAGFLLSRRLRFSETSGLVLTGIASLIFVALFAGMNIGTYDNAYVPGLAGLAILFGLGGEKLEYLHIRNSQKIRMGLPLVCLLQFGLLYFNVPAQIPTVEDLLAGEKIVALLKTAKGEVLIPYHSYLPILAGKAPSTHHIALLELRGAFGKTQDKNWPAIETEIASSVREKRFVLIITQHKHAMWQPVFDTYQAETLPYDTPDAFYPVTGAATRPDTVWTPSP